MMKTAAEKKAAKAIYLVVAINHSGSVKVCASCQGKAKAVQLKAYYENLYEDDIAFGFETIVLYKVCE